MIQFEDVSKSFATGLGIKKVKALSALTLQVPAGEVFGFLGPNGAGKSTAIKTLIHLIRPDSGRVMIDGQPVDQPEARRQVGYLPEHPYYYDYLTARELLWFGGRVAGMPSTDIRRRSDDLLARVSLLEAADRPLRTYSKGMVQRAGLAYALIHDPQVVILDEPMSGLDPIGRKMVGDLILDMKCAGKTVFFSSHILNDIERFSDRVGIVVQGRLRLVGTLPELLVTGQTLETVFLREVEKAGGGMVQ